MANEITKALDTMTLEQRLIVERRDRVATFTLNHVQSRNALSPPLVAELLHALNECADDPGVGAVLITGAGSAFSAGGDIKRMSAILDGDPLDRLASLHEAHQIPSLMATYPKAIIAAVNGAAAGAGLSLACACDLRLASTSARFTAAFVKVGLGTDLGAAWNLPLIVGHARARELLLTGRTVDAAQAERLGLVHEVVAHEELGTRAWAVARELAHGPINAHAAIKRNLHASTTLTMQELLDLEAEHQVQLTRTADHREAVSAFLSKRPPIFQGR